MAPTTRGLPLVPLKEMDAAMLTFELLAEIARIDDDDDARLVSSAAQVAAHLHAGQTRRLRADLPVTPYVEHPMRVALRLLRWGYRDARLVAAALLHDTLEDCAGRIASDMAAPGQAPVAWMLDGYGPEVTATVTAVTNAPGQPYSEKIAGLCASGSDQALLVKAGDLVDNAGSLPYQLAQTGEGRTTRLAAKYLPAVRLVSNELSRRGHDAPARRLSQLVPMLEGLVR